MSLFQLEKTKQADEIIQFLRESDSDNIRARAAEILGDLDDPELRDRIIDDLIVTAKADDDEAVRAAAVDALDKREAVERLIIEESDDVSAESADWARAEAFADALEAPRPELRMAAANALGRLGERVATEALVERLTDDHPRVRARAARALGRLADPRAERALAERVADPSTEVRREATEALGLIGGDVALRTLAGLVDDESETIRHVAASALGNFGSAEPVDALARALADESEVVRRAAVFSLIELLSNAPGDRSHQLRETMVGTLSEAREANVVDALVELVEDGTQAHQRRNATWLLGRVTGREREAKAVYALAGALGDDDPMVAQFASASLASIGGRTVEDALLDLLDDGTAAGDARAKAAFTLGKVGGDRSRDRLDTLIDETDDDEVRRSAFSALSKLGGRR